MNLRVRSVTGCSRSAIFASCVIPLVKVLGMADIYAATYRDCVAGSLDGRTQSSRSIFILRVCKIRYRLAIR